MRRIGLLVLLAGVWLAHPVLAQSPAGLSAGQADAVEAAIRAEMAEQKVTGVAVGVVHNGKVAFARGYGFADREAKVPVSSKSLFRWASCAKPLTAIAAMQLAENDTLNLAADIRRYVPEFPKSDDTITVRHLLCHQGGIVHYVNGKVVRTKRKYEVEHPFADVILALDTFKESPLLARPGEKYSYTTHGYILLSAVVERAGKEKFADQVAQRIAKPLGLTTLRPDYQWETIAGRVVGYRKKGDEIIRSTDTDVSWKLGGGGYLSNVDDFARFAAGLLNNKLVSPKMAAKMWEAQKLANGTATNYGLGFLVGNGPDGKLRVRHGGSQEKTRTLFVLRPHDRFGVVVMSNSEWAAPAKFADAVEKALAGPKTP